MKVTLRLLLIILLLHSCKGEDSKATVVEEIIPSPEEVLRDYVIKPKNDDGLCREDISRAKEDLKKYGQIYVTTYCFGCESLPYEEEVIEYATYKGFKVISYGFSCVTINGQTQGCYKAFIDLKMEEINGKYFRQKIQIEAEKLMINKLKNSNRSLSIYDLSDNDKPKLVHETNLTKQGYIPTIKTMLPLKFDRDKYPFVDISFIIEKDGKISNLKSENWVDGYKENNKYKKELESMAKKEILNYYNEWIPGKYKNTIARVENNFRVSFQ
ncbi:hypothetical protein NZD88_01165 [Chryseobacterium antibioticum]|uniref:Uncharacterized protein n=1 Tax=Chryseobacterium pyrolae TaxID=2987481 RepID=A0ABT2ICW0_9FLAO|nr:hypothetical protein [Chryseobacterium pyrolae]MCT2406162.1 hypothetical protein [Chryseobacterium pyrolae]